MTKVQFITLFILFSVINGFAQIQNVTSGFNYPLSDGQWVQANPPLNSVTCLATRENYVFVGTNGSGVFASTDFGISWTQCTNGLTDLSISCISAEGPKIVVGTYYGNVFMTLNNGNTWSDISSGILLNSAINDIIISNQNILFISRFTDINYLYRTSNNGNNWQILLSMSRWPDDLIFTDIAIKNNHLVVGGSEPSITVSSDNGTTWFSPIFGSLVRSVMFNGDNLFAGTFDWIFKSTDYGYTWPTRFLPKVWALSLDSKDDNIFVSASDFSSSPQKIFLTNTFGTYWIDITGNLSNDREWKIHVNDSLIWAYDESFIYKKNISNISNLIIQTGLISYYPFNGNTNDESGNNNHGTNYGATLTTDINNVSGRAYFFNGIDNYISIPDFDLMNLNSVTVHCVLKPQDTILMTPLYHGYKGEVEITSSSNHINFGVKLTDNNWYICQSDGEVNKWSILTGVWERANNVKLFLNGQFISQVTVPNYGLHDAGSPYHSAIGGRGFFGYTQLFNGKVDEVRFYNRALSPFEISQLHDQSILLKINSPQPNDVIVSGSVKNIQWQVSQNISNIKLELTTNSGGTWSTIISSYPAASGSYSWTVPNLNSTQCKIRISQVGGSLSDTTDHLFSIINSQSSISGSVKNANTNTNISGAILTFTSQYNTTYQRVTNDSGFYSIDTMPSGNYSVNISKTNFRTTAENIIASQGSNSKNFSIVPDTSNQIVITDGKLYARADRITNTSGLYFLSGNVNINGILYFRGDVKIDKRPQYTRPVIESSSKIYAKNIQGHDETIMPVSLPTKFLAEGNDLIAQTLAYCLEIPVQVQGFPLKMVGITIDNSGTDVRVSTVPKFPFPLNKLVGWEFESIIGQNEFESIKDALNSFSGKLIYNRTFGKNYELNFTLNKKLKLKFFDLERLSLSWNGLDSVFAGDFKIKIPGTALFGPSGYQNHLLENNFTIELVDRNGRMLKRTNLKDAKEFLSAELIAQLFELGFNIELRKGKLEKIGVSVGEIRIPIFQTGLFITEINANIENISDAQNLVIKLTCDIETGLEIPFVGAPISFDDAGGEFAPSTYFKLMGGVKVFDKNISNAELESNYRDNYLKAKGEVNVLNIIRGRMQASLRERQFKGSIYGSIQIPSDPLPPPLKWLGNLTIGDASIDINNNNILAQGHIYFPFRKSIAAKFIYGNPIQLYVGGNINDLHQIFYKDYKSRQVRTFVVPKNEKQILIVAENGMNTFDFTCTDPTGKVFNSSNCFYNKYEAVLQTVMIIENPKPGDWNFTTNQTGDITLYPMSTNQEPVQLINNPSTLNSRSNLISIKINDYDDTVDVGVYYDNDNKNFDGGLIKNFRLINNVDLNFEWINENIADGEYFIYTVVSDGKNAPSKQYAPGSILVDNSSFELTPQNVISEQTGDSIKVYWDNVNSPLIKFTSVFYKNVSDNSIHTSSIADTNQIFLTGLSYGKKYLIWAAYSDTSNISGNSSDTIEINFWRSLGNNPPCFINSDSIWTFVESEGKTYSLSAFDIDGNNLAFNFLKKPKGIIIQGNKVTWKPLPTQVGFYAFNITVSDGISSDTIVRYAIVKTVDESRINIEFNSLNLFEQDNKFLILRNFREVNSEAYVTIRNKRTNENSQIVCRRTGKDNFTGEFEISKSNRTAISVEQGDTIQCIYNYDGKQFINYSVYDTSIQISDIIPPSAITDLNASSGGLNKIKLQWTATGNDGNIGEALSYDIRYSFHPIVNDSTYFSSERLFNNLYPSSAGSTDSLYLNVGDLIDYANNDTVYFSIKAEDANQNRSLISNSAYFNYFYSPEQVNALLQNIYNIHLSWSGAESQLKRINGEFLNGVNLIGYRLMRRIDSSSYEIIFDSLNQTTYVDHLFYFPDGKYQYRLQAIYGTGISDPIFSNEIELDRFSQVHIQCDISDTVSSSDSIVVMLSGLDTIYHQSYFAVTGYSGLINFDNVFKSDYRISLIKQGFPEIIDTITISDSTNQYYFTFKNIYKIKIVNSGSYNAFTKHLNIRDTLEAELRNTFSPYELQDSSTAILDSLNYYATFVFENASTGSYYIAIKHRNMLETWSKQGGVLFNRNSINDYNFTISQSQAFGDNQTLIDSMWCFYAGDVNQDGSIDLSDIIQIFNDANYFVTGYINTDITGDNFVDISDLIFAYNNSINFVYVIKP